MYRQGRLLDRATSRLESHAILVCICRVAFWTGYHPVSGAAAAAAAKAAVTPGETPPPLPLGHAVEVGIDKLGELRVVADPPLPQTDSFTLSATTIAAGNDRCGELPASAAAAAATRHPADKPAAAAAAAVAAVVRASDDGPREQLALDASSGDGEALLQHVTNTASVCQLCTFPFLLSKDGIINLPRSVRLYTIHTSRRTSSKGIFDKQALVRWYEYGWF